MSGIVPAFERSILVHTEVVNGRVFCPVCGGFGKRKTRAIRRALSMYETTDGVLVLCWDCLVGAEVPLASVPPEIRTMKMPEWLMDANVFPASPSQSQSPKQIGE